MVFAGFGLKFVSFCYWILFDGVCLLGLFLVVLWLVWLLVLFCLVYYLIFLDFEVCGLID